MKSYKETKKENQDFEWADESFVSPNLSESERRKAKQEFAEHRRIAESNKSEEQKFLSKILQLKFQMEDYAKSDRLDEQLSFGYFLKQYIERINKRSNEFADEIDINPTELSQIINKHRDPNSKIIMRLEAHSNSIFPALWWYAIYAKGKTLELISDDQLRKDEGKHVKKRLTLSF